MKEFLHTYAPYMFAKRYRESKFENDKLEFKICESLYYFHGNINNQEIGLLRVLDYCM